ncbi:hypothetical protein NPIL_251821 [Nephila pilipes]|uniref:Uncharacterized protein n=1 Tax=Nephila pilipes TaxID=299642 RepID=A0A8X6MFD1_NEPPI|nr:hypothetical protein NPIL_251821 [Nephila pilipes]
MMPGSSDEDDINGTGSFSQMSHASVSNHSHRVRVFFFQFCDANTIIMKGYFSLMVVVCVILLTLKSAEMSPAGRVRRQSFNVEEISRVIANFLSGGILDVLIKILKPFLRNMGS